MQHILGACPILHWSTSIQLGNTRGNHSVEELLIVPGIGLIFGKQACVCLGLVMDMQVLMPATLRPASKCRLLKQGKRWTAGL